MPIRRVGGEEWSLLGMDNGANGVRRGEGVLYAGGQGRG